ncbi:hypothetical protein [Pseudomonas sp. PS01297]|uniref:hypothetical protein n=1 Tax=Pseudomonas sp. PS01297 TaxID=2991433 RepID=UPI00249BD61B|nr:hypothetical protein [Pseudomonas sp. PS01297]
MRELARHKSRVCSWLSNFLQRLIILVLHAVTAKVSCWKVLSKDVAEEVQPYRAEHGIDKTFPIKGKI